MIGVRMSQWDVLAPRIRFLQAHEKTHGDWNPILHGGMYCRCCETKYTFEEAAFTPIVCACDYWWPLSLQWEDGRLSRVAS